MNDRKINKKERKLLYKVQIILTLILALLSAIASPFLLAVTSILGIKSIAKIPKLQKLKEFLDSTWVDDAFWLVIAVLASLHAPFIVGLALIFWRYCVLQANIQKRRNRKNVEETDEETDK